MHLSGQPSAERLQAAAEQWSPGAGERLVLPGGASFRCIADDCGALCCRAPYRVDLDDREVIRLFQISGRVDLLDERPGAPITLMRQTDQGACALLTPDHRCGAYEGRPDGCRQYPFQLRWVDDGGREVEPADGLPLLMRDPACPGFIGEPLSAEDWAALVAEIARLAAG